MFFVTDTNSIHPLPMALQGLWLRMRILWRQWKKKIPAMTDYVWKDSLRPHPLLWQRYFLREGVHIEKEGILLLLDRELFYHWVLKDRACEHFIKQKQGKYFWKNQLISFNGPYEEGLLTASLLEVFPHEVAQIRIKDKAGRIHCSPVYHGKIFHCKEWKFFQKEINKLIGQIKKNDPSHGEMAEIEVNHTHPSLEFLVETLTSEKVYLSGLGPSDLQLLHLLTLSFPYPITLRAITPSGVNYSLSN